jgi:hypothetical protein
MIREGFFVGPLPFIVLILIGSMTYISQGSKSQLLLDLSLMLNI